MNCAMCGIRGCKNGLELAHNPLGAIYMADKYYKNRLFPPKD